MPAHRPCVRQLRMHCFAPMFTQKASRVPSFRQLPLLLSPNLEWPKVKCTSVQPSQNVSITQWQLSRLSNTNVAVGGSTTATEPISSPAALLTHLQALAGLPAMQLKLQVLSDALPAAPQPQQEVPCIDGINWEGDADSQAWQYDCKVWRDNHNVAKCWTSFAIALQAMQSSCFRLSVRFYVSNSHM